MKPVPPAVEEGVQRRAAAQQFGLSHAGGVCARGGRGLWKRRGLRPLGSRYTSPGPTFPQPRRRSISGGAVHKTRGCRMIWCAEKWGRSNPQTEQRSKCFQCGWSFGEGQPTKGLPPAWNRTCRSAWSTPLRIVTYQFAAPFHRKSASRKTVAQRPFNGLPNRDSPQLRDDRVKPAPILAFSNCNYGNLVLLFTIYAPSPCIRSATESVHPVQPASCRPLSPQQ